jgi:LmbE family N-acetylglucosaminyl deacetylase
VRVLLTAAHPDDTDFICGGTVSSIVSNGGSVGFVVVTNGELGLPVDAADLAVRQAEQRNACDVLGVSMVEFLGFPDGGVESSLPLRRLICRTIRDFRPDLVITHSPFRNFKSIRFSHPDHLAVGEATLSAVYPDARNSASFPELLRDGFSPHVVPEVWLHGDERSDHYVDISGSIKQKLDAVRCHVSQLSSFDDVDLFFRSWASEIANNHGFSGGALCEQYLRISTT